MDAPVLSAHAQLGFEEAESLVLQWFDQVGLVLGHAQHGLLIAWFDDDFALPAVAEIAVEVQFYRLCDGWSQLRWRFLHGDGAMVHSLSDELLEVLTRFLGADSRWSIDLCQGRGETAR